MLPVEWTEKREPGVVVPIPTLPLPAIYKLLAADPLLTTKAALLPTVNPPVMGEVPVVLVTFSLLIQAVSETVRYVDEALVMVPPVVVRLVIVPLVDQKFVAVKLVEEALVKVAVVAVKLGAVTSPDGAIEKTEEVDE